MEQDEFATWLQAMQSSCTRLEASLPGSKMEEREEMGRVHIPAIGTIAHDSDMMDIG